MNIQKSVRTKWIDVAKFMAIVGVIIDHTNGVLYTNPYVAYSSYFSVSLFIIVMGITTMWSYTNNSDAMIKKVWHKCIGIIRPYIVATIVYALFVYKSFDFDVILIHLIHFNMSGPFYYVLLYIQLVIISPILFFIFEKSSKKRYGYVTEVIVFLVILWIASWTTNHSNILGVYGGGGKLFGGTYLVLLYIGMWFGKYYKKISINKIISTILAGVACSCAIAWWRFIAVDRCKIDLLIPYGEGFNPPSISFGLYAILIASTLYFIETLFLNYPNGIPLKIMKIFAFMGKHTLYIFLYHRFFLDIVFPYLFTKTGIALENIYFKRIVYFVFMIGGSMLIEFILEKIHQMILTAYYTK